MPCADAALKPGWVLPSTIAEAGSSEQTSPPRTSWLTAGVARRRWARVSRVHRRRRGNAGLNPSALL